MILIADSGASKTDWAYVSRNNRTCIRFQSLGYNPNYITGPQIIDDINKNMPDDLVPEDVREIYFYGAGVTELQYPFMEKTLRTVFQKVDSVFIAMDTLASCRALLQNNPGFAAILGTGANSCLYDGRNEGLNIDSCGFILGDEGSGGYLGKRLITDYIRHNMPQRVYELLGKNLKMNNDELLNQIYTKPYPNRFCAQYAKFINENLDYDQYFSNLVTDSFRKFFNLIVSRYPDYKKYEFNAVGSIAYHFKPLLEKVAEEFGMGIGTIMKAPMDGLVEYHLNNNLVN